MLSENEIEKRLPIWDALSELFLDTELDEISHKYIAKVITESGYCQREINQILWFEVLPGVGDNLRCVAGEWAGFDREWLKKRILEVLSAKAKTFPDGGIISVKSLVEITINEWSKVCDYLPAEYSDLLPGAKEIASLNYKVDSKKWWEFWRST